MIRSAERMTYTNVHLLLEGDAALRERYAPLVARFELMRELALILNRKRVRRGSIDFDLPEPLIEFDEWGAMTGVTRAPRNIAHRIIEEFMLAANEAVAAHLEAHGRTVHLPHPREARSQARDGVRGSGGALRLFARRGRDPGEEVRATRTSAATAARARSEIVLADSGLSISLAQLPEAGGQDRRQARRAHPELPDAALAEAGALQHGQCRPLRAGRRDVHAFHFAHPPLSGPDGAPAAAAALDGGPYHPRPELRAIADECSQSERRAAEAERELVEWKKVKFMADRVGEEFDALIISTTKYGLFVELEDLFIEGLVPIDTLPGDRYTYHENVRKIVGQRTRREFSIGDQVRVLPRPRGRHGAQAAVLAGRSRSGPGTSGANRLAINVPDSRALSFRLRPGAASTGRSRGCLRVWLCVRPRLERLQESGSL